MADAPAGRRHFSAPQSGAKRVFIQRERPDDEQSISLLQASHALMERLFPPEENHFLSVDELCSPHISFFVAKHERKSIGCVALANCGDYGEVKSLYVSDQYRNLGIARKLMLAILEEAQLSNLETLRLETGDALTAAISLYAALGFRVTGPFGDYTENQSSVFMQLSLRAPVAGKVHPTS